MNRHNSWLLLEALLPLFGASMLFLIWGVARWLTSNSNFKYSWQEARDSMGWLYGAAILAMQSGWRSTSIDGEGGLVFWSFALAVACFLILLSAMTNRGESTGWKPPRSLDVAAVLLTVIIVGTGWAVQKKLPDGTIQTGVITLLP